VQGSVSKKVTTVKESWEKLSPAAKRIVYAYTGAGAITLSVSTYNAGKTALLGHRAKCKSDAPQSTSLSMQQIQQQGHLARKAEWKALQEGCEQGGWHRFWDAVTWPTSVASHVTPYVVLLANPNPNSKPAAGRPPMPPSAGATVTASVDPNSTPRPDSTMHDKHPPVQ
jgi:hypothetical protein